MLATLPIDSNDDQPLSASARMVDRAMKPVMITRTGLPPLEFVGRCLARNIGRTPLGIELWLRDSGDLVLVHPGDVTDRGVVQAIVLTSLKAARQYLMDLARGLAALPTVVDTAKEQPEMTLDQAVAVLQDHRKLAIEVSDLVDDALSDWDVLCEAV